MAISRARAARVRVVLLDVDGVLTSGGLVYLEGDAEAKVFNSRDGHAIRLALAAGLRVGVCSGRSGPALRRRAGELGCDPILLGLSDKAAAVDEWLAGAGLTWSAVAFVGDDLPDLACLRLAGLGVAVGDATHHLARHADHVTRQAGGRGAVGEFLRELLVRRGIDLAPPAGAGLHG